MGGLVYTFRPSFSLIEICVYSLKRYCSYFQYMMVWIGGLVFSPIFPLIKLFAHLKEFHYSLKILTSYNFIFGLIFCLFFILSKLIIQYYTIDAFF